MDIQAGIGYNVRMKNSLLSSAILFAATSALPAATLFETPVSVTGTGGENERKLSGPVELEPGARYLFSFTARRDGSGSGTVVTGPGCANVDWGISDPVPAPRQFVFRVPAGKAPRREKFHLGGWRMTGKVVFEDASVRPVKVVWGRSGEFELGHGEQLDGNRYSFTTLLGSAARNDSRPLASHTIGFNTDRWCAWGGGHVTYRHTVGRRNLLSGKALIRCGWYSAGSATVEARAGDGDWIEIGAVTNTSAYEFDLPPSLFPAQCVEVRARGLAKCSMQINSYTFEGRFDGAPAHAFGSTRYVDAATGDLLEHLRAPTFYDEDYGERISASGGVTLWRASPARKVPLTRRAPNAQAPAGEGIVICTAANEAESAQLVVFTEKKLEGVRVSIAGDLVSAAGARIEAAAADIRKVGYVNIDQPTDGTGCRAQWPDPLLPQSPDGCAIPGDMNQPFRIRVKPPKGTPKGIYRGTIQVRHSGDALDVPISVEVFGFELPDAMTCETAFGFSFPGVCRYHGLKTDAQREELLDKYLSLLSANHISPYNPAPLAPWRVSWKGVKEDPSTAVPVFDWTKWDAAMEKAFNHYHFNSFRMNVTGLGGGTFHSRTEPSIAGIPATNAAYHAMMAKYLGGIEAHLREKGWLDKAYIYWFDEPSPRDYEFVKTGFATLKRHAPALRRMLTEQPEQELFGYPNIWCPLTPNLHTASEKACRDAGDNFWWYVCCGPKAPYVTEFIDHPGVEMRLWSWQTWKESVHGLLIWATTYWTSYAAYPDFPQNPYEDPMSWVSGYSTKRGTKSAWGNGDGRLVYPPLAAADGRPKAPVMDAPVPTIRLEMLGDGIEDYEYFSILKRLLQRASAADRARLEPLLAVPEAVTKTMTDFSIDPSHLEAHRVKLARAIEELSRK